MFARRSFATIVTDVAGAALGQPAECASLDCTLTFAPVFYDGPSADFWTRGYVYEGEGTIPGPTIRASAGDTLRVTLVNDLEDLDNGAKAVTAYSYMMLNSTNIHTHGLHISPSSPADDVFTHVEPGHSSIYEYDIPADHAGGIFWYHPHSHGSSAIQTVGGAAGFLIINDAANEVPPEVAAMEDVVLVLHHLDMATMVDIQQEESSTWSNAWADQLWKITGTTESVLLVNGQTNPVMSMQPNTWYRWRLLFVTNEMTGTLEFLTNTAGCEMQLLAKDGVYLPTAPRAISSIPLYSALRSDLAVRCTAAGAATVGVGARRRRLGEEGPQEAAEAGAAPGGSGHDHSGRRMPPPGGGGGGDSGGGDSGGGGSASFTGTAFSITVSGAAGAATALPLFSVYRPCYLASTVGATVDTSLAVAFGQVIVNSSFQMTFYKFVLVFSVFTQLLSLFRYCFWSLLFPGLDRERCQVHHDVDVPRGLHRGPTRAVHPLRHQPPPLPHPREPLSDHQQHGRGCGPRLLSDGRLARHAL